MEKQDVLAQLSHVAFRYHKRPVLRNVSLTIERGAFLGLVGPNGSGKSTLVKLLLGQLKPTVGDVYLFQQPVQQFKQWDKIGYVSQKANRFSSGFPATVYEVVSMGLYGQIGLFRFLRKHHKEKVLEVVKQVGLQDYLNENIGELSGGQQQRVFIARALVSDPELLILDEPTVGVDAKSVDQFYGLLRELNERHRKTLLLITHDIGAVTTYVSQVACLNQTIHFHGESEEFAAKKDKLDFYNHDVHLLTHHHEEVPHV
ncbi:metal ABC transporter ATP-binding protein [Shouchella lonarensis]|uniref:Zinc transport system ATP-binding protein n=1 Tax=Shouchella lonarensis TaxID=1464122 RepID=A0A1G6KMP9_9BACI|nr:metal ABC transporter ATP-binding protein [Shouchella lonarensis]SDC32187.1 zinc transport system ATP-binding protein [Shouchella lonarensis]